MQTLFYQKCSEVPLGREGHSAKWPIRGGSAQKGTFFRLQVYERIGILLLEVYERVGKFVVAVCEWIKKGYQEIFKAVKKTKNFLAT